MQIACDRCGKPTSTTKSIKSKKNNQMYVVYVCNSGCLNDTGKFAYSFFPPKEPAYAQNPSKPAGIATTPQQTPQQQEQLLVEIRAVKREVLEVKKYITSFLVKQTQEPSIPDNFGE